MSIPVPVEFGPDGLVPVVTVDAGSGDVLMLAFMNEAALATTRETGLVHYWSRSRNTLWLKGETSGHVQRVESISINCDRNSLKIDVEQAGAVCHDGYPSCFYRRLEPDNSLTTVLDRWFDPDDVYPGGNGLGAMTRLWWNAYAYLRDNDLGAKSGTSQRLRAEGDAITPRLVDELVELAGAVDGSHRHHGQRSDVILEGSQVLYWAALAAIQAGSTWDDVRPDRALDIAEDEALPAEGMISRLLLTAAERWRREPGLTRDIRVHETMHLVATAARVAGLDPGALIANDIESLRERPYLSGYFATASGR